MVPKVNSSGHQPASTAFKGQISNYRIDAPFAFGTTGFLQRAQTVQSNTAIPQADYCVWLGTTRDLKGTHKCLNLDALREITGDIFRHALHTGSDQTTLTIRRILTVTARRPQTARVTSRQSGQTLSARFSSRGRCNRLGYNHRAFT